MKVTPNFSCTHFKPLQFIEEIHRSIDNTEKQGVYESSITILFGEFFIAKKNIFYLIFFSEEILGFM